jgi:hypothetical protein
MTGIENGLPVLALTSTSPVKLNGTSAGIDADVAYDKDTGLLKLTDATGATLWETNLHESMSYKSFTLEDKSAGKSYNFIAEFNEADLSGSPTTLTLWYETGVAATPVG